MNEHRSSRFAIRKMDMNQLIWTFVTCYILSSFCAGFVSQIHIIQWMWMTPVWFIISMYLDKTFFVRFLKKTWLLIIFVSIILFSSFCRGNALVDPTSRGFTTMIVSYGIYIFLRNEEYQGWEKPVVIFFLVEHFMQTIYTIYLLQVNPRLIRQLLTSTAETSYPFALSFAGTYLSILLIVFFLSQFQKLLPSYKTFIVLLIVTQSILILNSNLATAIILFVVSAPTAFFIKKPRNLLIVIAILSFFLNRYSSNIGAIIVDISKSNSLDLSVIISDKLYELGMSLQGIKVTNANGTYVSRQEKMIYSVNTFFQHPFWGVYATDNFSSIGGHSTWLDTLAMFGVIRGVPFWIFFIGWIRKMMKDLKNSILEHGFIYALLLFIVEGQFNPIIKPGIVATLFIIIPLSEFMFKCDVNESLGETEYVN